MTADETRAYFGRMAEAMREASRPYCTERRANGAPDVQHRAGCQHRADEQLINVASYWRPTQRHLWRRSGVRVNVEERIAAPIPAIRSRENDGAEYAEIPYDADLWSPPARTRILPGLPAWPR